jgi:hypothetical protein
MSNSEQTFTHSGCCSAHWELAFMDLVIDEKTVPSAILLCEQCGRPGLIITDAMHPNGEKFTPPKSQDCQCDVCKEPINKQPHLTVIK